MQSVNLTLLSTLIFQNSVTIYFQRPFPLNKEKKINIIALGQATHIFLVKKAKQKLSEKKGKHQKLFHNIKLFILRDETILNDVYSLYIYIRHIKKTTCSDAHQNREISRRKSHLGKTKTLKLFDLQFFARSSHEGNQ